MPRIALPLNRKILAATALVGLTLLAGCSTPAAYAPRGPGQQTGYTDRQLGANRWRVTFTGNSVTPREQVEDDLLLRAAEVSLAAGFSHFVFDTRDTATRTRVSALPGYQPSPFYWGNPWAFRPRWGYGAGFGGNVDIITTTSYQAYAEIIVLTPEQAARDAKSLDAKEVIAHLRSPAPPPPV